MRVSMLSPLLNGLKIPATAEDRAGPGTKGGIIVSNHFQPNKLKGNS
jgi:hypothetical protein